MLRLPDVYTILPGVPFAKALATQLLEEYRDDLRALSDVRIYLPNRRSIRALANCFLELSDGQATLLPHMLPLGDIDEEDLLESDPFALDEDPFLTPAIAPLERQILLAKMIAAREDLPLSPTGAFRLAGELGQFLDRAHTEQVDLSDLDNLVTGDLATHWQITRDFLRIIIEHWPKILHERGESDPAQRRNLVLQKKIQALRDNPPAYRVIAAGSTGSIPASAALLATIARLPQGCVVLPGFDPALPEHLWQAIDETHPYFYQKRLLDMMAIDRQSVKIWPNGEPQSREMLALAHYAMQPQAVFDLSQAVLDTGKLNALAFTACDNPLHEAKTIALMLRDVLNDAHKTAMVVTPDRVLAGHIQQEMTRWDIPVNDSAGQALGQTGTGVFLRLVAGFFASPTQATHLLALMRHPLFRLHGPPAKRRQETSALDKLLREDFIPHNDLYALMHKEDMPAIFTQTLEHLRPMSCHTPRPLHEWIETHIAVAEALATTVTAQETLGGEEILWRHDEGQQASALLARLYQAAEPHAMLLDAEDYSELLAQIMDQIVVRPAYGTHPRLTILSNIEARLQHADLVILSGLNEGVWPAQPKADTWLSRPMQQEMKFGAPERRIGQSALDFMTLFCMKNVHITYSQERDGAIAHPSRWLQQVFAVLKRNGITPQLRGPDLSGQDYAAWAAIWDKPQQLYPQAAPSFSPPVAVRPRRLPVTSIGTWKKDPYALYARRILLLKPLEQLDRQPDPRDWGNAAHRILEHFIRNRLYQSPDPLAAYHDLCHEVLSAYPLSAALRKAWEGKLAVLGDWLVNEDIRHHPHILVETVKNGTMTLTDGSVFEFHGRADRIEQSGDAVLITDYKTGTVPSDVAILRGHEPQLPLLGILHRDPSVNRSVDLRYIKLIGKQDQAIETRLLKDPEKLIEVTATHLEDLLQDYYIDGIAYVAQNHGDKYDAYRHLKRVAEWAALPDRSDDNSTEENT